jgi:hypothetical protein
MKSLMTVVALSMFAAVTAPAFAQSDDPKNAKTQAECIKAGGQWDAGGKLCLPK